MVRPRLRYYSQSKAEFYHDFFPPDEPGAAFYSADQRLSGFGSISGGVRLERQLGESSYAHISLDYMRQDGAYKTGSPGSPGLDALDAAIIGVGFFSKW